MVAGEVRLEHPRQVVLVQDDKMPQALLPKGANELLHVAAALRTASGDLDRANATVGGTALEGLSVERITVPNQEARTRIGFLGMAGVSVPL